MPAALNIDDFEPFAWVAEFTQPTLEIHELTYRQIVHFSLIWNLFERHACGRFASIPKIELSVKSAIAENRIETGQFAEHSAYFRHRAANYGHSIDDYVSALNPQDQKTKEILTGFLNGGSDNLRSEVTGLLVIAYRIRNNLFHGEKEVAYLHTQVELFRVVNSLLATYLTATKSAA